MDINSIRGNNVYGSSAVFSSAIAHSRQASGRFGGDDQLQADTAYKQPQRLELSQILTEMSPERIGLTLAQPSCESVESFAGKCDDKVKLPPEHWPTSSR